LEELGFIAHEDWHMTLQSPVHFSFVKSSRLLRFPLGVCIPFFRHYHNILSRQKKIRSLVWGILGQIWAWVLLGFDFSLLRNGKAWAAIVGSWAVLIVVGYRLVFLEPSCITGWLKFPLINVDTFGLLVWIIWASLCWPIFMGLMGWVKYTHVHITWISILCASRTILSKKKHFFFIFHHCNFF
jgi:hypothetical protein